MEINNIEEALIGLTDFWQKQNVILRDRNTLRSIHEFEMVKNIELPQDFKKYFLKLNGMENLYPNYLDEEGFLFYPLKYLTTLEEEFGEKPQNDNCKCLVFSEFMHKSWWYGVRIEEEKQVYDIVIISSKDKFKSITNSLAQFIHLYMNNSPVLYDYA